MRCARPTRPSTTSASSRAVGLHEHAICRPSISTSARTRSIAIRRRASRRRDALATIDADLPLRDDLACADPVLHRRGSVARPLSRSGLRASGTAGRSRRRLARRCAGGEMGSHPPCARGRHRRARNRPRREADRLVAGGGAEGFRRRTRRCALCSRASISPMSASPRTSMLAEGEGPAEAFRLPDVPGVAVVVERAGGIKCARSWRWFDPATADPAYPDVTRATRRRCASLPRWAAGRDGPVRRSVARPVGLRARAVLGRLRGVALACCRSGNKIWAVEMLDLGARPPIPLLPFLDLVLAHNRGISYSLFRADGPCRPARADRPGARGAVRHRRLARPRTGLAFTAIGLGLVGGGARGQCHRPHPRSARSSISSISTRRSRSGPCRTTCSTSPMRRSLSGVGMLLYESFIARPSRAGPRRGAV